MLQCAGNADCAAGLGASRSRTPHPRLMTGQLPAAASLQTLAENAIMPRYRDRRHFEYASPPSAQHDRRLAPIPSAEEYKVGQLAGLPLASDPDFCELGACMHILKYAECIRARV